MSEQTSNTGRVVLNLALVAVYLVAVVPFIVHLSYSQAGTVVSSRQLTGRDLPAWARSYPKVLGVANPTLVQVTHEGPERVMAVLTDSAPAEGKLVVFSDPIIVQATDWRTFDFVGFEFDELVVAELKTAKGLAAGIEDFSFYSDANRYLAAFVMLVSTVAVIIGPVLVALYLPHLLFGKLGVWHVLAAAWLYAYALTIMGILSGQMALGIVLLIALGVVVLHVRRYERGRSLRT